MYLDYWVIAVFALLFGFCAWWNRSSGVKYGIEMTIQMLEINKIIAIENDEIVPFKKKKTKLS